MFRQISGSSSRLKTYKCANLIGKYPDYASVDARHNNIPGFDQNRYRQASITAIGSGGLNGETGEGFVRKGIGALHLFDGDTVEPSNLNRQLFTAEDIGENKAVCLAKNLSHQGFMGSLVVGYPFYFQKWLEENDLPNTDLLVCAVDNDRTRIYTTRLALRLRIPVIYSAVSADGNVGYVFVHEPGKACLGCVFPDILTETAEPCPNTPAIKDILKVVAGIILYAADTVLCDRKRGWNYRQVLLSGFMPDVNQFIEKRTDCPLCGTVGRIKDESF
jgi:molybdopterin/thiamine biosynthesis adenylyltransferase